MPTLPPAPARQRGTSLIEALVAFLVLSLGALGLARLQATLHVHADLARQRSEAVRLAQGEIERLRAFSSLAASPGRHAFEAIVDGHAEIGTAQGYTSNTTYQLRRHITDAAGVKAATIDVAWQDRRGVESHVRLDTLIAGSDPIYAGMLAVPALAAPALAPFARHAAVPLAARNLGDGRSALVLPGRSGLAFVFDNTTGVLTSRCTGVTEPATRPLTAADLSACSSFQGAVVGGHVRFSLGAGPRAGEADDTPRPLTVAAITDAGPAGVAPACAVETLDHAAAYWCVVPLAGTPPRWSGRIAVAPQAGRPDQTAPDWRVCRYAADRDGEGGAVQARLWPAAGDIGVGGSRAHHNFLVVRLDRACPPGTLDADNGAPGERLPS